jgi:hypothetical protein
VSIKPSRTIVIGVLALLAILSAGVSSAYAEGGPFWHHRAIGEKGEGTKIEEKSPETVQGKGGKQTLEILVGGTNVTVVSRENPFADRFFNISWQGQIEQTTEWSHPEIASPGLKGCEPKINSNNQVKTIEHLAWKWNGLKKQLELKPQAAEQAWDLIVLPEPMAEGETKVPGGTFSTVALSGEGCGVLAGKYTLKGNLSVIPSIAKLETWSTSLTVSSPGWPLQHIWNGKEFVGVEPGLTLGEAKATLTGSLETKTPEEIAVFEK